MGFSPYISTIRGRAFAPIGYEPAKTDEPATPATPAEPATDPNAEEIDKLKKECQNLSERLTEKIGRAHV